MEEPNAVGEKGLHVGRAQPHEEGAGESLLWLVKATGSQLPDEAGSLARFKPSSFPNFCSLVLLGLPKLQRPGRDRAWHFPCQVLQGE